MEVALCSSSMETLLKLSVFATVGEREVLPFALLSFSLEERTAALKETAFGICGLLSLSLSRFCFFLLFREGKGGERERGGGGWLLESC